MNDERSVFSVSELNSSVARLLEQEFSWIWVEGEISNLAMPASGHIYFTLKDAGAQVRCAMFRGRNRGLKFTPENGTQVLVRCKVSLYEVRGDYQLIVDRMEEAGGGALQRKYEERRDRLMARFNTTEPVWTTTRVIDGQRMVTKYSGRRDGVSFTEHVMEAYDGV